LEKLKALPKLKTLQLSNLVDVQAADAEKLKAEMPGVAIQWKPLTESERGRLDAMLKDD
jgi:hypothetical protein